MDCIFIYLYISAVENLVKGDYVAAVGPRVESKSLRSIVSVPDETINFMVGILASKRGELSR